MKILAIILIILAVLTSQVAVNNVFLDDAKRPAEAAELAGYVVGSFLVPLVLLIIGLILWNKAKGR